MKKQELLTLSEVAERLGLALGTVSAYRARGRMPEPTVQYGRTPLWSEDVIDRWRATQPRAGQNA